MNVNPVYSSSPGHHSQNSQPNLIANHTTNHPSNSLPNSSLPKHPINSLANHSANHLQTTSKQSNHTTTHLQTSVNATGSGKGVYERDILTLVRSKEGERKQLLTYSIQDKVNPVNHTKEVYLQVTDKQDPFLFYSLCVNEEDFQHLKSNQGLLVDFTSFPGMLRQLKEKCLEEADSFILILATSPSSTTLQFTELNLFKHLAHLTLVLLKATDTQLKEYLVDCIKQLQVELDSSGCQLSSFQQQLGDHQRQLEVQGEQLAAARREQVETSSSLGKKMMTDIQQEKERTNQRVAEIQNRFEVERREADTRHRRALEQMENRVASLDVQNRDLLEGKYRTESTLRETRSWLAAREEELSRVEADLHNTGRERGQLESRLRGEEQMSKELGARILDLEREAEEKEKSAGSTRDSNQQLSTQMQELHAKLKEKTDTVVRRESAVRNVTEELMKANEIIRKLQDQLKQETNKSKLRGKIAAEQEKLLADKDRELTQVREELKESAEKTADERQTLTDKEEEITQLHDKIEQLDKVNRSNENVISWLNKQLASFKSTQTALGPSSRGGGVASGRGGKARLGGLIRKSTSDVNTEASKENEPLVGLDPKYFEHSTPRGSTARTQIPDVRELPTNIRRGGSTGGGLLRR